MNSRLKKIILIGLAIALLFGVSQVQRSLNLDRERLGLTRMDVLQNAPPVLAFTTVALGGFRGLISNLLWIRATELQEEDKFFEMAQLADWITKLEPNFSQVWLQQAWNMAYNISVKFKDFPDRWNWVKRGFELLRDEGLKYNPNDLILYRELGWIYQHKMGYNMDDAHSYYKRAWYDEMSTVIKGEHPDFDALINPQTDDERARAKLLKEKFKLDPKIMKWTDETYGPLEWRLPEAHAIYWGVVGLKKADEFPDRVKLEDRMTLHRLIYQSMHQSVLHGRIVYAPKDKDRPLELGPQLDLIKKTSDAYERALVEEPENERPNIQHAHLNLIRDAIYYLYTYDRRRDAATWFDYLAKRYPGEALLSRKPDSTPQKLGLDDYVLARLDELAGEANSQDRVKLIVEGLVATSFKSLAMGDNDRAVALDGMAGKLLQQYRKNTDASEGRVVLPPLAEIKRSVLQSMLDPEAGLPDDLADQLRTALNLPVGTNILTRTDSTTTNSPKAAPVTNAPWATP